MLSAPEYLIHRPGFRIHVRVISASGSARPRIHLGRRTEERNAILEGKNHLDASVVGSLSEALGKIEKSEDL